MDEKLLCSIIVHTDRVIGEYPEVIMTCFFDTTFHNRYEGNRLMNEFSRLGVI